MPGVSLAGACLRLGVQVKDNFDRFISCKNTIDDIHLRLRSNESGGNSTTQVAEAMQEVRPTTFHSTCLCLHSVSSALWRLLQRKRQ